jgi:hypothetical protein
MKLTRYIRPTARRTAAQQIAATDRDGIAITITEGEQGRTWADALKQLKPGGGLLVETIATLGRRRDTVCERLRAVFDKGASVVLSDGTVHAPDCGPSLIAGLMARGVTVSGTEPGPRVAHNRTAPDILAEARKLWTQKQFARMTNGEIAAAVGLSVPTLAREFGKRSEHVPVAPGRPRKQ